MAIDRFQLQHLAVPGVVILISFLAYGSQVFLLSSLDPGDLTPSQRWWFNALVACIWISYWRAVTVSPGRVPQDWHNGEESSPPILDGAIQEGRQDSASATPANGHLDKTRSRWCRKCEQPKPPRAHHCKVCKRCIPKMDHHCPWTANCVSHFTFPHFIRFLFYATTSMVYLEYFFVIRASVIWSNRELPSYLGPTMSQLVMLFIFTAVNSLTLFGVGVIFIRSVYDLACNTTTIEGWEISRHEQLLRRARALGGFLYGPDGQKIIIKRQEFPYDIGILANICQGMGSANPLSWFWVFSSTRRTGGTEGMVWETNGFEDESIGWPPVDPDRIPRTIRLGQSGTAFVHDSGYGEASAQESLKAFRKRQVDDLTKRGLIATTGGTKVVRRKRFHDRFDAETYQHLDEDDHRDMDFEGDEEDGYGSGEEGWRDDGGSRLNDYGVDEEVEFYDEDDIPLAELLRQRRALQEQKSR